MAYSERGDEPLSRPLTDEEERDFRKWARENWVPGMVIQPIWHAVIRDEIKKMLSEMTRTFTAGTTPEEVIAKQLPFKYPMTLTREDMLRLLRVLNHAWGGTAKALSVDDQDWAMEFRSSILTTLDIEEV